MARVTRIPEWGVHSLQMLYELQTMMAPDENITIPWRGPGCTGIVAVNTADNMVYHARNLDFSPKQYLQNMTYTGIFKRKGQEIFRAQMIAGYFAPSTAMKKGPNGFAIEQNTRFPDH